MVDQWNGFQMCGDPDSSTTAGEWCGIEMKGLEWKLRQRRHSFDFKTEPSVSLDLKDQRGMLVQAALLGQQTRRRGQPAGMAIVMLLIVNYRTPSDEADMTSA